MNARRTPPESTIEAILPRHWKLTADQYQRMGEVGILCEDDRVELLEGELYEMAPIGDWHSAGTDGLNRRLDRGIGERGIVRVQGSFRLAPDAEPQPDILVLRFRPDFYRSAPPGPKDVLLLVEIADTTLAYDRDFKLPLYARAGIPEVWIVNRAAMRIEVYRGPEGDSYQSIVMVGRSDAVVPLAFPDLSIPVAAIVG